MCRDLLKHGDAEGVLRWLDIDEREAPDSRFTPERGILRVRALMISGDERGARQALAAVRKAYPTLQLPADVEALAPRTRPPLARRGRGAGGAAPRR
jgi:hypothetical protein